MPTEIPLTAPDWSAEATAAIDSLAATHTPTDRHQLHDTVQVLAAHPPRIGQEAAVDRLLARGHSFADRARDFAAAATLAHLGVLHVPVTWPGWAPPPGRAKRLLAPLELALLRLVASAHDTTAVQVALLEAGASSGELAEITASQISYTPTGLPQVTLPGTRRLAPRTIQMAVWSWTHIRTLLETHPAGPLVYRGRSDNPQARQAAVLMSVSKAIDLAGWGADSTVTPDAIRNSAARLRHDAAPTGSGLKLAADSLGITDLHRVAERIGIDPTEPVTSPPAVFALPPH